MRDDALRELGMLQRRIVLVLWATTLAVLAALMVCLLVGVAFTGAYFGLNLQREVAALFVAAVVALTFCLLIFLREISIAAVSAHQTLTPQSLRVALRNDTAAPK
jgi:hypothetical protein